MDGVVARDIADEVLARWVSQGYASLATTVGQSIHESTVGSDGKTYQLETSVFWDDESARTIRVLVSVDDGGRRAFVPLCVDEIVSKASDPEAQ